MHCSRSRGVVSQQALQVSTPTPKGEVEGDLAGGCLLWRGACSGGCLLWGRGVPAREVPAPGVCGDSP